VQTDITTFGSTLEGSFSGDDLAATEVILPEFTRLELTTNVTSAQSQQNENQANQLRLEDSRVNNSGLDGY